MNWSRPDWVKEQIQKLNDENVLARIDKIVELDEKRREIRTRTETAQASRNKLNKAMGKLRGNKKMDEAEKDTLQERVEELHRWQYGDQEQRLKWLSPRVQKELSELYDTIHGTGPIVGEGGRVV